MNNIHKHLEFKITEEENNNINYLDITIHRHNNTLSIEIIENLHKQTSLYISHPTILSNKNSQLLFSI
jgi:hypothetical protein